MNGKNYILKFQSTLPAREATTPDPLARSASFYFKPRFPRGKRLLGQGQKSASQKFQSPLPAREATDDRGLSGKAFIISIHASREGSDQQAGAKRYPRTAFQSTLPAREATSTAARLLPGSYFNPRFPRGKRPHTSYSSPTTACDFNPRFPRGKRHFTSFTITISL